MRYDTLKSKVKDLVTGKPAEVRSIHLDAKGLIECVIIAAKDGEDEYRHFGEDLVIYIYK